MINASRRKISDIEKSHQGEMVEEEVVEDDANKSITNTLSRGNVERKARFKFGLSAYHN